MGRFGKLASAAALATVLSCAATAQQYRFDVPPQDLKYALRTVTREAGFQLFAGADDLRGLKSPDLHATTTVEDALQRLLAGTDLHAEVSGRAVFIRGRSPTADAGSEPIPAASADIVVTGSHIAGNVTSSLTLTQNQQQIVDAGQTNLGDVIRSIPQNFGGGQNPGIGFDVPVLSGQNVGGGSSLNLRGLGQDATLTLVNGHRQAYGGERESIDVSAIPLGAIDRIEIVPDGASAIYGSDAVAGVGNVILKRDYDGLSTSGTIAGATDGGALERLASTTAGKRWASGGFVITYEYGHTDALSASDRSFGPDVAPTLTLLPSDLHHEVVFAGHQQLTEGLSFSIDALFNARRSDRQLGFSTDADSPIETNASRTTAFSVTPALHWRLAPSWTIDLQSTYGFDRIHYGTDFIAGGADTPLLRACNCNSTVGAELGASGTLVDIAGHAVSLALGGGYRSDRLRVITTVGSNDPIVASQSNWYGYGELGVPIIQAADGISHIRLLKLNLAGRYESYSGVGHVATPKVGLLFSPSSDIDFKTSWGKSFRAPTLFERFVSNGADLYAASDLGGAGLAPSATALLLSGGNASLKPEKAMTWSETVSFHPKRIQGLSIDLSYFSIRYRDRVVIPITYITNALSDPAYRSLVTFNPSAAEVETALQGRTLFVDTGGVFDPSEVAAIINNDTANAARQKIHGFDIAATYKAELSTGTTLTLDGDVSYLNSRQQTSALQPEMALAGSLYNPPHVRARGGMTWASPSVTLSSHLNFAEAVRDVRVSPAIAGRAMTTVDLAGSYRFADGHGVLKGIRVTAAVDNLFDRYPGRIATTYAFDAPYDSTNYSPFGRRLSLTIAKDW